jgi:hypothetical protein
MTLPDEVIVYLLMVLVVLVVKTWVKKPYRQETKKRK